MGDLNFRIAELDAENQELHDENERLRESIRPIAVAPDTWNAMVDLLLKQDAQNLRLVEALRSYMGKFGDCGPVYEEAAALLAELKGE